MPVSDLVLLPRLREADLVRKDLDRAGEVGSWRRMQPSVGASAVCKKEKRTLTHGLFHITRSASHPCFRCDNHGRLLWRVSPARFMHYGAVGLFG